MKTCDVYLIGHAHATFGHAVKVGVAGNAAARLSALQTGNIEDLKLFFSFTFDNRGIALEVERLFHLSELAGPVRGEWVGCNPVEALFYLNTIIASVLSRHYSRDDISEARRRCGLLESFGLTDHISSEQQAVLNDRIEIAWEVFG